MWGILFGPWCPFLIVAVLFVGLAMLAYRYPSWREERWKALEVAATLLTAAAAVSIPLVLDRNARDTRTLELLNEASRKISEAAGDKDKFDKANGKVDAAKFKFDYINSSAEVKKAVFIILNEYDYICLGANQRLFSNAIVKNLRWDALDQTWIDYHDYIAEHRKAGNSKAEAWIQCDMWLKKNPRVR